jgi:hypothetical protein
MRLSDKYNYTKALKDSFIRKAESFAITVEHFEYDFDTGKENTSSIEFMDIQEFFTDAKEIQLDLAKKYNSGKLQRKADGVAIQIWAIDDLETFNKNYQKYDFNIPSDKVISVLMSARGKIIDEIELRF